MTTIDHDPHPPVERPGYVSVAVDLSTWTGTSTTAATGPPRARDS